MFPGFGIAVLAAAVVCSAASSVEDSRVGTRARTDSVHFTFNPPLGRPYWVVTDHESTTESEGKKRETTEHTVRRITVARDSAGFHLMYDPDTMIYLNDGAEVKETLIEIAKKARPTVHLDSMGRFVTVTSRMDSSELTTLASRIDTAVASFMVQKQITDYLREKQRVEWSFYYEMFSGQTVAIGDGYEFNSDAPLPGGGSVSMKTTILVDTLLRCSEEIEYPCVLIRYLTTSDDIEGMKGMIRHLAEGDSSAADADSELAQMSGMSLVTRGTILMDPRTMLIYDETQARDVSIGKTGGSPDMGRRRDTMHRYIRRSR